MQQSDVTSLFTNLGNSQFNDFVKHIISSMNCNNETMSSSLEKYFFSSDNEKYLIFRVNMFLLDNTIILRMSAILYESLYNYRRVFFDSQNCEIECSKAIENVLYYASLWCNEFNLLEERQ